MSSVLRNTGRYLSTIKSHQGGPRFILQQDNDPKHTAKVSKNHLQCRKEQEVLQVMARPPQSPLLNIIEGVWDNVKDLRKPTPTEDLWIQSDCATGVLTGRSAPSKHYLKVKSFGK